MISVYFDSQIFRNLKNRDNLVDQSKSEYSRLHHYVFDNKNRFLFFFSHAHLLDLKNDKTEKKFEDLLYMEEIVEDNYLVHEFKAIYARYYLRTPMDAFQSIECDDIEIDWSDFFNVEKHRDHLSTEDFEALNTNADVLKNLKIGHLFQSSNQLSDPIKQQLNNFIPIDNPHATFIDLLKRVTSFSNKFRESNNTYKDLRNMVASGLKYTIDLTNFDLTVDYAGTQKQQHFLDHVKSYIHQKEFTQFDLHYQAYFQLDLLGLQMEKSKKIKTNSMLNDGHHSYYGAYCDILVSDDIQLREKSKILYKLFGLETKVLTVEEFIAEAFWVDLEIESSEVIFWRKIRSVINTSLNKKVDFTIPTRQIVSDIAKQNYLSYFNSLSVLSENGNYCIFLTHSVRNYSSPLFSYKIVKEVVNKSVHLFGIDNNGDGLFNYEKEVEEINKEQWCGREWKRDRSFINLEINTGSKQLTLAISMK